MFIKKKITISNILMIVVPVVIAIIIMIIGFFGRNIKYWDSLEEMFEDENGIYSAQSIIYAFQDDINDSMKMKSLTKELTKLGYNFNIEKNDKIIFSNLTNSNKKSIKAIYKDINEKIDNITMSNSTTSFIKSTFNKDGVEYTITSIRDYSKAIDKSNFTVLERYIKSTMIIFVFIMIIVIATTNTILSRWISNIILNPLTELHKGVSNIANGSLDYKIKYDKKDEFGDVCRDFNNMGEHLKKSVETQLNYEQYRKELIAGVSHDLRTPLTSIKCYVQGLKDGIANTPDKKEKYYNAIETRIKDMESLVDNLTLFSSLENDALTMKLEVVKINDYINKFISENEEEYKNNSVIIKNNCEINDKVEIDYQEMKRVFYNIIQNSIKYRKKNESIINIDVTKENENLEICIRDDGPGIDEKDLQRVFMSFYRGDKSRNQPGKGNGLGLAISKRIVECNNGTIEAKNMDGLAIIIKLKIFEEK